LLQALELIVVTIPEQSGMTRDRMKIPVIAVFDVGKTNKKVFFFDEQYKIVLERTTRFEETADDDGDPCEDVASLSAWVKDTLAEVLLLNRFDVKAVNFSAYGASFVHLDQGGNVIGYLYNYLKPYPPALRDRFYGSYGGEVNVATQTASPVLGCLNSGLQLYRIKYDRPDLFSRIKNSLHLPQYLSYLVTGKFHSDITSIGCHTQLWDFVQNDYHHWVKAEGIDEILAPVFPGDTALEVEVNGKKLFAGIGLHDSSSALIPFFASFQEPFVLLSTGTWCVSLNPFNSAPLTEAELNQDCLCYISYKGKPVKASRLFAGNEHEQESTRIADAFNKSGDFYKHVRYNPEIGSKSIENTSGNATSKRDGLITSGFSERDLSTFGSAEEAYHQLIADLVKLQAGSTGLVLKGTAVKRIFVDGGFSQNPVYMQMLASAFPAMEVFAASVAQATSIGAALAIHKYWNRQPLPTNIIDLKFYSASHEITI
jgi:sugar (pentulose or hexulose) kinase